MLNLSSMLEAFCGIGLWDRKYFSHQKFFDVVSISTIGVPRTRTAVATPIGAIL